MEHNLKIPASIIGKTTCIKCRKDNSLELYDMAGQPMKYQLMVNMNRYISLDNSNICVSHFKCTNCGVKYNILWDNGIPKPLLTDTLYNTFIRDFTSRDGK